jgi:hypothetical protein
MKFLTILSLLLAAASAKAQLAVISDPDGFVNIRETGNINSKVVSKLNTDCIVLYDGETDNNEWKTAYYSAENTMVFSKSNNKPILLKKDYITGFVNASRIIPIDQLPQMRFKKGIGYLGNNDTINFSIKTKPFSARSHKIVKSKGGCNNCAKNFIDKIDGKQPWGIDGNLPTREIYKIVLSINKMQVEIPFESYNDLYQPNLENLQIHYDKKGNVYLYMPNNSDGAGGYDIVWVVNNNKLIKRYVDSIG